MLVYDWKGTQDGVFPTAGQQQLVTTDTPDLHMSMGAIMAVYTTIPSMTVPASTSSDLTHALLKLLASPAPSSNGLTRTAKVGIGVGVGIGVSALIGVIFSVWMMLRRSQRMNRLLRGLEPSVKPELGGKPVQKHQEAAEMSGHGIVRELHEDALPGEVEGKSPPQVVHEMPDTSQPAELNGDKTLREMIKASNEWLSRKYSQR